jgi:hypothetical protein
VCYLLSKPSLSLSRVTLVLSPLFSDLGTEESAIPTTVQAQIKESHVQPVWHVFVLTLLTAGWYLPFWVYKNSRDLSRRASAAMDDSQVQLAPLKIHEADALRYIKRCWPAVLAIGAFLPFVGAFVTVLFCRTVANLSPNGESVIRKHSLTAGILLMLLFYAASAAIKLPGAFSLLYLAAVFPVAILQHWLNQYWRSVEPEGMLVRQSFSATELVLLVFGIMLTGMLILHFFFDIK